MCPKCSRDEARLLAALSRSVILRCLRCGEVWEEENEHGAK